MMDFTYLILTMTNNNNIKQQDWTEFDKLFSEQAKFQPDIKSAIKGFDSMSDAQHKMIVAIFTNELKWNAIDAFKFIVKILPDTKARLKAQHLIETDLREVYKVISKKEAIKLINILKSISRRRIKQK